MQLSKEKKIAFSTYESECIPEYVMRDALSYALQKRRTDLAMYLYNNIYIDLHLPIKTNPIIDVIHKVEQNLLTEDDLIDIVVPYQNDTDKQMIYDGIGEALKLKRMDLLDDVYSTASTPGIDYPPGMYDIFFRF